MINIIWGDTMNSRMVDTYVLKKCKGRQLNTQQVQDLKDDNIEQIVYDFFNLDEPKYIQFFITILKSLRKLLNTNNLHLLDVTEVKEYINNQVACQIMDGDVDVLLGISGNKRALLRLASYFAKEDFQILGEDAYDAICELTNCLNGAYATVLSKKLNLELSLYTPAFYDEFSVKSGKKMYLSTWNLENEEIYIIMAVNSEWKLK